MSSIKNEERFLSSVNEEINVDRMTSPVAELFSQH